MKPAIAWNRAFLSTTLAQIAREAPAGMTLEQMLFSWPALFQFLLQEPEGQAAIQAAQNLLLDEISTHLTNEGTI